MNKLTMFRLPAAILSSVSLFVLFVAVAYPQPKIEFDELEFDWGEIMEGDTVTHAFRFQNTGNKLLRIEKVKSG